MIRNSLGLGAFAREGWNLCVSVRVQYVRGNETQLGLNWPDVIAECIFGYIGGEWSTIQCVKYGNVTTLSALHLGGTCLEDLKDEE